METKAFLTNESNHLITAIGLYKKRGLSSAVLIESMFRSINHNVKLGNKVEALKIMCQV